MKKQLTVSGILILGVVALCSFTRPVVAFQKSQSERVLTVKQMMSGLVKPHKAALETALKEAPASKEAWQALVLNAALLNESGYLLVEGDRSPGQGWTDASKTLREESVSLIAALKAQDFEVSKASFKTLTTSCANCHKAYKK